MLRVRRQGAGASIRVVCCDAVPASDVQSLRGPNRGTSGNSAVPIACQDFPWTNDHVRFEQVICHFSPCLDQITVSGCENVQVFRWESGDEVWIHAF